MVDNIVTPDAGLPAPAEVPAAKGGAAPIEDAPIVPVAKHKIKWGETEKEVTLEEALKLAEKANGIEEKARTAAQQSADAQALLDMMQNDWKGFAKRAKAAGVDPQKLATDILYENIRLNSLTPEQRELEELKARDAETEAERKSKAEQAQKVELEQKTNEWVQKFEAECTKALTEHKIPNTRQALSLIAMYIDSGLAQKKEYTVEQVLPYVKRDLQEVQKTTMGSLDGEDLLNYLGDEITNKVAAARVARYKKGASAPTPAPVEKTKGSLPKDITKLKGKAYWSELRKLKSEQGIEAFPGQD